MTVYLWENQPPDKHFWAFLYYCKRQGDIVHWFKNTDGTFDLLVYRQAWGE